jgi:hypothetical protein
VKKWLRRVRGAVGLGLSWGVAGFLVGAGIEVIHNVWPTPLGSMVDLWPAALGYPAFFGGVVFSTVLGIAGRGRRFDDLSLGSFAAWGAVGGLIVSLIPAAMVAMGLVTPNIPLWQITGALVGPLTVGGAVAASGSLTIARMAEDRELLDASRDVNEVRLTAEEAGELLGDAG